VVDRRQIGLGQTAFGQSVDRVLDAVKGKVGTEQDVGVRGDSFECLKAGWISRDADDVVVELAKLVVHALRNSLAQFRIIRSTNKRGDAVREERCRSAAVRENELDIQAA
jgi:hypothetical protein